MKRSRPEDVSQEPALAVDEWVCTLSMEGKVGVSTIPDSQPRMWEFPFSTSWPLARLLHFPFTTPLPHLPHLLTTSAGSFGEYVHL
jgi:hypothetical protein